MSKGQHAEPGEALAQALRMRAGSPPGFAGMLRAARLRAAPAGSAPRAPSIEAVPAWRQLVAAGGVLAMAGALWLAGHGGRPAADAAADLQLARDLAIARELAPERQWHVPTDALISARGFHTPVIVELPGIDNPFKESVL